MSGFRAINVPPSAATAAPPAPSTPSTPSSAPGKAEFAEDVETEEFYVVLEVPPADTESIQRKGPPPPVDRVQILDLHTANPLVSCRGQIYSCSWADSVGTGMYFLPPPANDGNGSGGLEGVNMEEITAAQIIAAAKMEEEGELARLVGIGGIRLEGRPVNVKMAGDPQSKRKTADEALDFANKLEETLTRRKIRDKLTQKQQQQQRE